jgi:hypothetical protein
MFVPFATLLLILAVAAPLPLQAQPDGSPAAQSPTTAPVIETGTDDVLSKLDPRLRELIEQAEGANIAAARKQLVAVDVIVRKGSGTAVAKLFDRAFVRSLPERPLHNANSQQTRQAAQWDIEFVSGRIAVERLIKVASVPQVNRVLKQGGEPPVPPEPQVEGRRDLNAARQRVRDMKAGRAQPAAPAAPGYGAQPNGWFEKTYVEWQKAWAAGYTGAGVDVAVLDSGIDFAHPDLNGLQARVIDPESPYFYGEQYLSPSFGAAAGQGIGLPVAFDATSVSYYTLDVRNDVNNWGFYIDTSRAFFKQSFSPYIYVDGTRYRLPDAVVGSEVRVGFSSDNSLRLLWTDADADELANIPILLANTGKVDLDRNGNFDDFDTVYTDLDNDGDFSNDKPAFLGDETMWWDGDSDSYADVSGGMMYFIADGTNAIPSLDWLYGDNSTNPVVPAKGDVVVLMVDDVTSPGGAGHGTRVASNVVNKAIVNGGAPDIKPPYAGPGDGMVQAASKDTRLVAMGNFYEGGSIFDWYLFSLLSYDGFADDPDANVDDPQIVNQSFGNSIYENAGFDTFSRLIAVLNYYFNPFVLYTTSAGNGGPGAANVSSPDPWTGMTIGASTQSADPDSFDPFETLDQAVWGDMQPFSNQGPDARGTAGVELSGNGAWGAGDVTLNTYANGWFSWETWGGTSRANPTVVGTMANAYQAWRERTGAWPNFLEARYMSMSSATYNYHNPTKVGSGISNAARMALAAGGDYGVWAAPSLWNVGEYRGADKQNTNFVNILPRGDSSTQTFTLNNPSGAAQNVTLRDGYLQEVADSVITGDLTTTDQGEETPVFGKPDYLVQVPRDQIPADTDLMVVRTAHSYETFDADDDQTYDSRWRLLVYDWTDLNDDGNLFTDTDSDGYVDGGADGSITSDELDVGEYNRYGYSYATGTAQEMRVQRPLERSHDGVFIGWEHRSKSAKVPTTELRYEVRFYRMADWPQLDLSSTTLAVPAGDDASFDATFATTADTPLGFYEGYIFGDMAGTGARVRVAHLAPDAPNVDVYLDDTRVLTNVPFRTISPYLEVAPGMHRFRVVPTGEDRDYALIDVTTAIADGTQYTVAATGTLAPDDAAEFGGTIFADENYAPNPDTAKLRVIHTAANAPAVDVYAGDASATDTAPGARLIAGLPYGRASDYLFVPAGAYQVRVYPTNSNPQTIAPVFTASVTLNGSDTYHVFATGDATDPQSLQLLVQVDDAQQAYAAHTMAIPVTVNVASTATGVNPESIAILGGADERADTVYDNSYVQGLFNWTGSNSDDNRRFFLDAQDGVQAGTYLLLQNDWGDRVPTDMDTLILGPTEQPCTFFFNEATCGVIGNNYNAVFGPYVLDEVGGTGRNGAKPVWEFGTATGTTEDWTSAPVTPGLHQIFHDTVLFSGDQINVPFTTTVGLAQVTPISLTTTTAPTEFDVSFVTNIDLPNGMRGVGYGMGQPIEETFTWTPDEAVDGEFPDKTSDFTVANAGVLEISTASENIGDIDIYLYRITDDGELGELVAQSAGSDSNEFIRIKQPEDGAYRLVVDNFSNLAGSATAVIDLLQGTDVEVTGLPTGPVPAGTVVNFTVRITRALGDGEYRGVVFIGPTAAPTAIEIPIGYDGGTTEGGTMKHRLYVPVVTPNK